MIRKVKDIFESITCLCAEGPEFHGKMELVELIAKEAVKGYFLCRAERSVSMAGFEISYKECGAKAEYDPNQYNGIIGIQFDQGSPNIMDKMIIFCARCRNKEEVGIEWPLRIKGR